MELTYNPKVNVEPEFRISTLQRSYRSTTKQPVPPPPVVGLPSMTSINRTVAHPTRYWETLVHLLKGNIGAGLFAMGDAYKNAGLIGGLIGTLFIGSICIYCSHILIWSSAQIRKKLKMDADPSFEETVEFCFEYGPKYYRKSSKLAGNLVKIFIVVTQLGFCCVFFVFVADSFESIFLKYNIHVRNVYFVLAMYVVMMVVCLIGHLKYLTPVSLLGTIFLFFGIVVILVISSIDLPPVTSRPAFASAATWPLFFGTVVYAFEGIALVIPLRAEMREPDRFGSNFGVFNVGMIIVMVLFNLVGFIGYLRYGEDVQGSVSFNLPPSILAECVRAVVALGVAFSYPLQFFVASTVVFEAVKRRFKNVTARKSLVISCIVRGSLVTVTCLIAIFVPNLGVFISLIGAVSSTALALVFPVLCHVSLYTCPKEYEPQRSSLLPLWFLLDAIALTLAALGFATGTYFAISKMIEDFNTLPFASWPRLAFSLSLQCRVVPFFYHYKHLPTDRQYSRGVCCVKLYFW